ncbi:E3 ubiquitin-protein ligase RNF103-like [Diadema antillarum]|uniref:E3 ubiquitin-protein ligase RNF103-like n=1 Tax=Diadema antillarum TaxID=105358 RepID=UPI003A8AF857
MEMLVKKVVFLLMFTLLLFMVARLLELIAWYETGLLMMKLVDPVSLSVKKLKSLLDGRGLSYEGVVDKAELTHLLKASGGVMEGEVLMMEAEASAEEEEEMTTKFSSKSQFDEEVEDKKDSVWLVQVIPRNNGPLLGRKAWSTVVKKLSRFGIRHGTFDCSIDPIICKQKHWNLPLLLLAMPEGHRYKHHVTMATFTSAGKANQIISWVNTQLALRVKTQKRIASHTFPADLVKSEDAAVKMVLLSQSKEPPMFFSALNLKYSGRVKFVFVNIKRDSIDWELDRDLAENYPKYFIVTPEGKRIYGDKNGEYYNYKALDIYLHTLSPEANDIFVLSFTIVNIVCFIGLFVVQGGMAKRVCTFIWTLGKYNITFILLWLPLLGIIQLPCMSPILDYIYSLIRLTADTRLMVTLRQDWLMYSGHSYITIATFLLFCLFVQRISKKLHRPSHEDNMTSATWLRASLADFYSFLLRPSPMFRNRSPHTSDHLEEGLDLLIEQMAVPDLWLHPKIPSTYIKDLLTWRYTCDWLENPAHSFENDSSDSERECTGCREHKKRCPILNQCVPRGKTDCRCKWRVSSLAGKKQNTEYRPSGRDSDNGNIFVVQPKSIKSSCSHATCDNEGAHKIHDSGASFDTDTKPKRSEAELKEKVPDNETPTKRKNEMKSDVTICKGCEFGPDSSQIEPETIGEHKQSIEKHTGPNNSSPPSPTKRNTPKCYSEVEKSRTSSRRSQTRPPHDPWPQSMIFNAQCAICLEAYTHGMELCGLPCSHAYHRQCIVAWLNNGNHVCPICRWPAYKKKGYKLSKHME